MAADISGAAAYQYLFVFNHVLTLPRVFSQDL
jgi:hypothetical protein